MPMLKRLGYYLGITLLTYPVIFILTMIGVITTGSRETGMYLGSWIGVGTAWLLYPMIFWRPFTLLRTLLALAIIAVAYGCLIAVAATNLRLHWDLYGLYDLIIFYSVPCMLLFEVATQLLIRRKGHQWPPAAGNTRLAPDRKQ